VIVISALQNRKVNSKQIECIVRCKICNNDTKDGRASPTEAPAHLYVASNELRSPGVRPEFRFPNGLLNIMQRL